MSYLAEFDQWLWNQGNLVRAYQKLGAHPSPAGTDFAVWAPHAEHLSVIGDFNDWNPEASPLARVGDSGLWHGFVAGAKPDQRYKYRVRNGYFWADKTDPFAFRIEAPVRDAFAGLSSLITDLSYEWHDAGWLASRKGPSGINGPVAIYELHLGSWQHTPEGYSLGYREIAAPLADYLERFGFTHVEFMPLAEHAYYGSWGYQTLGYFAATQRFGSPQDLMYLIDYLHQRGFGVIMDWAPAHFATDPQGLVYFDGAPLFEYEDPRMRYHPDWGSYIFDYGKPGVQSFLVSSALFWLDHYHIDGLRIDAVASMLYRDYSRPAGGWVPNIYGGNENLEAIALLKKVNETVYANFPETLMIAEESTAFNKVSWPTYDGGLGFQYKWNMGWMHDTLAYIEQDPIHRRYHHDELTFSLVYAWSEHYVLPLSHDEVVHGKRSLWGKMPGDPWQKAANLRLLLTHMVGHPGKKMLFMGGEFGQEHEWNHDGELQWDLLEDPLHAGLQRFSQDLFQFYRQNPALWLEEPSGFEWIDFSDRDQSIVAYLRKNGPEQLVFILNFTPVPRYNYRLGVPGLGLWQEVFNSDSQFYAGSDLGNLGQIRANPVPWHGRPYSLTLTLPPLAGLVLKPVVE